MIITKLLLPILTVVLGATASPVPEPEPEVNTTPYDRRAIEKRSFMQTCIGPYAGPGNPQYFTLTSGHILNGNCLKPTSNPPAGVYHWQATTQDLNLCITNSNGNLQWLSNGVFKLSCPNTGLRHTWIESEAFDQVYLWADCYTAGGSLKRTEIRLNDRIHNWGGSFACTP
ncbi:hypothetical protein V8F20_011489 [Naviculisporaceae sp. PSN 640]